MSRDRMRVELTAAEFNVINGDILIGDERAGSLQFHIGEPARRVMRRLRKMGLEINQPRYVTDKLKKS